MKLIDTSSLLVKRGSHGLGLYTKIPIKKGVYIIEYTGERISSDEANRRGGQYLFELNDNWTIDGKGRENKARYINHSCIPNCEAELSSNETRVFIRAKRNIAAGEELTYNYGKDFWKTYIASKGCRCKKCFQQVTEQPL
jgi:SET domain-containing protein